MFAPNTIPKTGTTSKTNRQPKSGQVTGSKKGLKGAARTAAEKKAKRQNDIIQATVEKNSSLGKSAKGESRARPETKVVEDEELEDEEMQDEEVPASNASSKKRGLLPVVDNDDSTPSTPSKRRLTIKQPRKPTTTLLQYQTTSYTQYDPSKNNAAPAVTEKFKSFSQFDDYTLVIDPTITKQNFAEKVPTSGVRLDDRTAAIALLTMTNKALHDCFPAEFDNAGMIRATRVPLGHAYKKWIEQGLEDVDGNVVTEAGYYYMWWRGLHCMMGKEGLDAGLYKIRPSFESFKCTGFGFKISHKAVIQHQSGSSNDPTFD